MNILFFPYNAYPPEMGGIARITCCLIDEFRNNEINVIKLGHCKSQHSTVEDDRQYFLPDKSDVMSDENEKFAIELCKNSEIDVVFCQAPIGSCGNLMFTVCKRLNIKSISCFHTSILTPILNQAYVQEYTLKSKGLKVVFELLRLRMVQSLLVHFYVNKYRKKYRYIVDNSSAVVLLCDGQVEELKQMCGYDKIKNAVVIPNCMIKPKLYRVQKSKSVVWVGTFDCNIKRPDYMLEIWGKVWQQNPEWKLYMLGDGPEFENMKMKSSQMGLNNIEFTGRVSPDEYYEKAQILCVTSTHEAFPLVTLESMFYGLVPIAFNSFTSANQLIKANITGELANPFDIEDYAKRLNNMINSENKRKAMSENSIEYADEFINSNIFPKWKSLFDSLIQ